MNVIDQLLSIWFSSKKTTDLPLAASANDADWAMIWSLADDKLKRIAVSALLQRDNITVGNTYFGAIETAGTTTTNAEIVTQINTVGFTIAPGSLHVLEATIFINDVPYRIRFYMTSNAAGDYGTTPANPILYTDLLEFSKDPESIDEDNNNVIDLGDIGTDDIWDHINALVGTVYELDAGEVYQFNAVQNAVNVSWLWIGVIPSIIGDGGTATTSDDFYVLEETQVYMLSGGYAGTGQDLLDMITAIQSGVRQRAVIDIVDNTAAPPTEVSGDRYILDNTGASHANWDGAAANDIVQFDGVSWVALTPEEGYVAYVDAENIDYRFIDDGSPQWEGISGAAGVLLAANNLSDLASAATARANLGLVIGTNVEKYLGIVAAGNIATTFTLDHDNKFWNTKTMTADTTFSDSNLVVDGVTRGMYLTGNFVPTFPAYWTADSDSQTYDGTVLCRLTWDVLNASGGSEDVRYFIKVIE